MSILTTLMGLGKAVGSDNARDYLKTTLAAALDVIDAHDHSVGQGNPVKRISNGLQAAQPAAGSAGNVYWSTDQHRLFVDNGSSWNEAVIAGTALSAQLVLNAGLNVTAGGVQVQAGGLKVVGGNAAINSNVVDPRLGLWLSGAVGTGTADVNAAGMAISTVVRADRDNVTLYGLDVGPGFDDNARTGVVHTALMVRGSQRIEGGGIYFNRDPATYYGITQSGNLTGNTTAQGILAQPTAQNDVSFELDGVASQPFTAASAFTVGIVTAFHAYNPVRGAGSTINTAAGMWVDQVNTGTLNNYGVYVNAGPSGGSTENFGLKLAGGSNHADIGGYVRVLNGGVGSGVATAGALRLSNNSQIGWRNTAGTSDVVLAIDTSDRLVISGALQAASATAGAASLPAAPAKFLVVNDGGGTFKIALYNN